MTMEEFSPAVFGLLGAILGAVLGFTGSILATFGRSKDTQLEVRTKIITNERAQWRSDMRELTADFVSMSKAIFESGQVSERFAYDLERTRVLIRLRLNPNPGHRSDRELLDLLSKISRSIKRSGLESIQIDTEKFEATMQALIKQEWQKSKNEAETGNVAQPDAT